MDFNENIYGAAARLSFVKRIREEKKFSSVPDLVAQIGADVQSAERIFRDLKIAPGTSLTVS
jgi:riboflavin kinase/FMN adenylyltransferase